MPKRVLALSPILVNPDIRIVHTLTNENTLRKADTRFNMIKFSIA